ncbi:MAG: hypothetical protein ACLGSD_08840 [Acidobacteriota bacterium]
MRRIPVSLLLCAFLALFVSSSSLAAQDRGYWTAASSNAKAITGDLTIGPSKLGINFAGFPLAPIRQLTKDEGSAAFDVVGNEGLGGELYRVTIPASRRFLHHNTLCGTEDTQWMATYVAGRTLYVDFFSGSEMPKLTMDALANSTDLCGTFVYAR